MGIKTEKKKTRTVLKHNVHTDEHNNIQAQLLKNLLNFTTLAYLTEPSREFPLLLAAIGITLSKALFPSLDTIPDWNNGIKTANNRTRETIRNQKT
jgi:hypothetical protein